MPSISLNIFTNCTASAPSTDMIERTYKSFCETFGEIKPTIWCDMHPNIKMAESYIKNLLNLFSYVNMTSSLSDGYLNSIQNPNNCDYLFQLEHDWLFNKDLIKHSLTEIIEVMDMYNIYHFRFNKRTNRPAGWDKYMNEQKITNEQHDYALAFCRTNNISNNPHIISRKKYLDEISKHVKILSGSKGVEEELNAIGKYESCVYGPAGYPATITHQDGRGVWNKKRGIYT